MPGFTLKGKIQLDGSQWNAGLAQAKTKANRWSNDVSNMIRSRMLKAFAVSALIFGVDRKTAKAGQIRDQSTTLGIDPETFQKLDFAAQQSAGSVDDAAKAIKRLSVSTMDALRGSKDIQESFERFGITMETVAKLKADPASMLFLVSELVEQGVNPTALGDVQKILGKSGAGLIPAFKAGFAGAGAEAERVGAIATNEEIFKAAALGDKITTQKFKIDRALTAGLFNTITTAEAAGEVGKIAAENRAAVARNKQLEAILAVKQETQRTNEILNQ